MNQQFAMLIQWPGSENALVSTVVLASGNEISIRRDFVRKGALSNAVLIDHKLNRRIVVSVAEKGIDASIYRGNVFGWPALFASILLGTVLVQVKTESAIGATISLANAKKEIAGAVRMNRKAYTRASAEELISRVQGASTWIQLMRRFAQD